MRIRTTRAFTFWTHEGTFECPAGTLGVITSVGEVAGVWAKVAGGYEMEIRPGEYEVASDV